MKYLLRTVTCLVVLAGALPLYAQTVTTGTLTGVVSDQQGGVLPGATVSAVHAPTGTTYTVTRDPAQRSLRWRAQPVAGGTLYWETELKLREV